MPLVHVVAEQNKMFGYRFVPLVQGQWHLMCSLNILVLRRDFPGSVIEAGDIDNRIKTLIDTLRRPKNQQELVGKDAKPDSSEDPFFVLMEDDDRIEHFSVEADHLLDPLTGEDTDKQKVRAIVTVELKTYYSTLFNQSLVRG